MPRRDSFRGRAESYVKQQQFARQIMTRFGGLIGMEELTTATVDQIVSRYADAAAAHLRASEQGDYKTANPQHDVVTSAYRELRARGKQEALFGLLSHQDPGVRSWAATHALEFAPADGQRVLEDLIAHGGLAGFNAQVTLDTWREGKLRLP